MKKRIVFWLGLVFVLSLLMAACSGTTPTPKTAEPEIAESVVTEQPAATEEEAVPTDSEALKSTLKMATDFTLVDSNGNMVNLSEELQENEQVVLVFYINGGCLPCMAQLREIENDRARYEEKAAQVIAIAVQSEEQADRSAWSSDAKFPILADSEHTVAEAFGVLEDDGVSTPSVFIIGQDRNIVWSEITHIEGSGCGKDRVPSETILENLG